MYFQLHLYDIRQVNEYNMVGVMLFSYIRPANED